MSSKSSRGQLVFRSSLLYVWVTRGPFGRHTKSLCDFGDMTPHTLVGGAQTTLTARASVVARRADRRNDPREALGPRGNTQSRPPEALDRCAGGHRGRRDGPQHEAPFLVDRIWVYNREGVHSTDFVGTGIGPFTRRGCSASLTLRRLRDRVDCCTELIIEMMEHELDLCLPIPTLEVEPLCFAQPPEGMRREVSAVEA